MHVVERITKEDVEYTNSKFKLWDKTKDVALFTDPTIWAYAMLNDEEDNPLKLFAHQDMVINDKNPHVQMSTGRQIGKTTMLSVKSLHHAIFVPNANVVMVSRSQDQATLLLDNIKGMIRRSNIPGWDDMLGDVQNRMEMDIRPNNKSLSKLRCMPPTERGRGFSATLLPLDENAFWEGGTEESDRDQEYLYQSIFEPTVAATRLRKHPFLTMGQIISSSSPNGQQGVFWNMWNDARFSHYRFDWRTKPGNTQEAYDAQKLSMARIRFDSEYAALFVSQVGGFITQQEFTNSLSKDTRFGVDPTKSLFLGLDTAGSDTKSRDVDLSVMYGGHVVREDGKPPIVVCTYGMEFPKRVKKGIIFDEIKRLNNNYSLAKLAYDKMGVGDSIAENLIKDKMILSEGQVMKLTYSGPQKSEVYYNLKMLFEQGRIRMPYGIYPQLKEQLMGLTFTRTDAGHLKQLQKNRMHDDHADAFANFCYSAVRSEGGPVYAGIVSEVKLKTKNSPLKYDCNACGDTFTNFGANKCPYCGSDRIEKFV